MIVCEKKNFNNNIETVCSVSHKNGYYFNSESEISNHIYYCNFYYGDNEERCSIVEKDNGYFFNSYNTHYIKCNNSICTLLIDEKENDIYSCSNCDNQIIVYQNNLYYWSKNKYTNLTYLSKEYYYELSNVNATFIYPEIKNGTDTILLKINEYSLTQYISEIEESKKKKKII